MKRMTRSSSNRIFLGVMGGMGDYLDTDPALLRVAYIILTCLTGFIPGLIAYFLAALVMPTG